MVQIALNQTDNSLFKSSQMPILLYAGQIADEPEWTFPSHKHDELCEIIYISEGEGDFIIDNHSYNAQKGDILVYNQGIIHDEKSNPQKPLKTYFCGVGALAIKGLADGFLIPNHRAPVIHADKYSYKIENYFSNIFEECSSQVLGFETISQHLLVSLIILIIRITTASEDPAMNSPDSLGYRIKEYIDKNYTREISLDDIANHLYLSPYYISHIFKKEVGLSTINYLITRRVGEAKKLLLTTDATIEEISRQVGYENSNYFAMLFKKITGTSPGKFRQENKKT
jgi:AraC-like DNA-binding protein/mannose-6-phosphate isomerase-like protein (cupin superfamily)